MKKILKRTGKVFCLFLLIVVLVNVLSPLFCRKPDETYVESLREDRIYIRDSRRRKDLLH